MRIAVDFDGTAEREDVQDKVLKLIAAGHYIEIVTTRNENPMHYSWYRPSDANMHTPLFDFVKKANIPYHFTNMQWKADYLEANDFDYLIDDNALESIELIKCQFINVHNIDKFISNILS